MTNFKVTRREAVLTAVGGGVASVLPGGTQAATSEPSTAVDTQSGKVRGLRKDDISTFLGIPYGGDTGGHRFQPASTPTPWTGVRDCFTFGAPAPQGTLEALIGYDPGKTTPEPMNTAGAFMGAYMGLHDQPPQSEDCLCLNIFTPEASPARKRPVMVWLHGGGFTHGSGGGAGYDGSALCRRGDVVVVSLNHRLNALGYLYLGDLHADFADSGNVGQLDIVLALQWVRDNIAAFGGDPDNVTIFGESGGGSKVGALLGAPPADGLFHKAIMQSGSGARMLEKDSAAEIAERTLQALGVAKADVHKLQGMDRYAIIEAASKVQLPGERRTLMPVVDGRSLPRHPFAPTATEISRDVPLIVGTTKDEGTMFLNADPQFGSLTTEQARQRFGAMLGEKGEAAFEVYRGARPDEAPIYWVAALMTDMIFRTSSIQVADRKAAQKSAPVYMYRLDWETPAANGLLKSPHGLDLPLMFHNLEAGAMLVGDGPEPLAVADAMTHAWLNFARSSNPSTNSLSWPRYDEDRRTMLFNINCHVVSDPNRATREFWAAG